MQSNYLYPYIYDLGLKIGEILQEQSLGYIVISTLPSPVKYAPDPLPLTE
jgi:hypothetical protein